MSQQRPAPQLECGRDLLALVEQVSEGRPPAEPEHQATCPFCQEAIVRLRTAFDALHQLAGETVRAPRGLSGRVLEQLRRERHSVLIAAGDLGRDTVSEVIVSQVARRAALGVDVVHHASVVSDARQDGSVHLTAHVTVALGPALPDVVALVRERVIADVWRLCGARVARVDVTVADVA